MFTRYATEQRQARTTLADATRPGYPKHDMAQPRWSRNLPTFGSRQVVST